MKVHPTSLPGLLLFELDVVRDERGAFVETYQEKRYAEAGVGVRFVQDNLSRSAARTLRGLHYQLRHPQAKLVHVVRGEVYDVAVDIRLGSPTFGRHFGAVLSEENRLQLFIPGGFAHGFCALGDAAYVAYKVSASYAPDDEHAIAWSDPALAIPWPTDDPIVSPRDRRAPLLCETAMLPTWSGP